MMFKGDFGSKFAVSCPPECSFDAHFVFGIDNYSDESSIC